MVARNGILGARAAVYRGAAVLSGAEEGGERRRRSGPHRRNLATPTPEGGEKWTAFNILSKDEGYSYCL